MALKPGPKRTATSTGKVEKTVTKHKYNSGSTVLTTTETFTYSPQDKLLVHKHKINTGSDVLIAKNNYDELGQLIKKEVGGTETSSFQKIDYKYNIRGWLKEINNVDDIVTDNDLFAFKIKYNDGATPLFNGNISETYWKSNSDNVLRKYEYTYDKLNRLLEANYNKLDNPSIVDSYLERLQYDKNGNITSLVRNGDLDANDFAIEIDNLVYTYDTNNKNQLMKVLDQSNHPQGFKDDSNGITDTDDDYDYDVYGNLIKDDNKDIDRISYNHLNLPHKITFANGTSIEYIYNAVGQKVRKIVRQLDVTNTDYMGGFQYVAGKLNFFPHAEGYVNVTVGRKGTIIYNYVYQYKDHLGNNRLSYTFDIDAILLIDEPIPLTIFEENHYYPFGLKHSNYNTNQYEFIEVENGNDYYINITQLPAGGVSSYKYKYNGKEYQDELGLNMYDYGARNYDPALGRWMNIDPLAEVSRRFSPYTYALNNPIYYIDPDGMKAVDFNINENVDDCCPDLFNTTPPKNSSSSGRVLNNFTPSSATNSLFQEGINYLKRVFSYEVTGEVSYGVGGGVQLGPVNVEGSASATSASISSNKENAVEINAQTLSAGGSVSIGDKNSKTAIKGEGGVSIASGKATVSKNGKVDADIKGPRYYGDGTMGTGKDIKVTASSSATVGLTVKAGSAKASGSVNFYNAAKGLTKMVEGGMSYFKDIVVNTFSWN